MKTNVIVLCSFFMIIFAVTMVVSCQKESTNGDEMILSQDKVSLIKQMVDDKNPVFIPNDKDYPEFKNLNDEEVGYFLKLLAKKWASIDLDEGVHKDLNLSEKDAFEFRYAQFSKFANYAKEKLGKPYNHLSNDEFREIIDTYSIDILYDIKKDLSGKPQKLVDRMLLEASGSTSYNYKSISSCPTYYYGIQTYSAWPCYGYCIATNPGDPVCGSRYSIKRSIVIADKSIGFLIGKGRGFNYP